MDPWSAGNSDLGLGFVHRCFPWFPGGGRWGGMALHSHPGAPATHVPRLLADGVGAGSKRDRHGHRRGGKGSGRAASWSRGSGGGGEGGWRGRKMLRGRAALPSARSTVSLQTLLSPACACFPFRLPPRPVSFSEDNASRPPVSISF